MSVLRELWAVIAKMFAADGALSLGLLAVVAVAAALSRILHAPAGAAALLLAGAVAAVLLAVVRASRRL